MKCWKSDKDGWWFCCAKKDAIDEEKEKQNFWFCNKQKEPGQIWVRWFLARWIIWEEKEGLKPTQPTSWISPMKIP